VRGFWGYYLPLDVTLVMSAVYEIVERIVAARVDVLGHYFELSKVSYTLIALFGILHVIGSHDTYSLALFGYMLQRWFGAERNMYDRMVHFAFGFLLAYQFLSRRNPCSRSRTKFLS
jgi:uncharacterized membrane protein YjdF